MGIEVEAKKPHVIVLPWPAQGHINPSLAFAKCLASKGLQITLLTSTKVANSATFSDCSSIAIDSISDGSEDLKGKETAEGYFERFRTVYSRNLVKFMDDKMGGAGAGAIIYDSTMPWVQNIAKERGLVSGPFFTQACAASAVFYYFRQGLLRFPYEDCAVGLPVLPELQKRDLPSFSIAEGQHQSVLKHITDQFLNLEKADWIFFNTFDHLESQIIEWMRSQWPAIKTVGPTFLLEHNDGGVTVSGRKNHSISLFEPKQDSCREWLESKETSSVVYVSFGSIASVGKEQMEELAYGLKMSNCHFLWVVRSSEVDKLPKDFNSEKGLMVGWCHQLEVLSHRAVACFMSHCGWNSTLEALSNGVPIIAMAQWVDQNVNAKFIEDVWRVGVGVRGGENGIVGREEIAMRIKEVVEGIELKRNACRWKELAGKAVENGGTSANNVDHFVSKLILADRGNISPTSVLISDSHHIHV